MTNIIVTFLGSLYLFAFAFATVVVLSIFVVSGLMDRYFLSEKISFLSALKKAYYSERITIIRCVFLMIAVAVFSYFIIGINIFNFVSVWNYSETAEWKAVSEMGFTGFFAALKDITIADMIAGISELSISNFILITVSLFIALWFVKKLLTNGNKVSLQAYAIHRKKASNQLRNAELSRG